MSRVALAACEPLDLDPDLPLLVAALGATGVDGAVVAWDDERVDWASYDLVVVRATWDYPARRDDFLAWATGRSRIENSLPALAYSSDKHYLGDLEAKGVAVVPTHFCDVGTEPVFFEGDVVVKPCVGAGSNDAARYGARELEAARRHVARLHARGRDAMIQPYVDSVDTRGEHAVIVIDGAFSHAMTKAAMLNVEEGQRDYAFRRQQMTRAEVDPAARRAAEVALSAAGFRDLLYGRVDLVFDDGWRLMELELVEPSLFLSFDEQAPGRLARAIATRLV